MERQSQQNKTTLEELKQGLAAYLCTAQVNKPGGGVVVAEVSSKHKSNKLLKQTLGWTENHPHQLSGLGIMKRKLSPT